MLCVQIQGMGKMKIAIYGLAAVSLLNLQACSDPKAASEKNFSKVIEVRLKEQPICLELKGTKLPGRNQIKGPGIYLQPDATALHALAELELVGIKNVVIKGEEKIVRRPYGSVEKYKLPDSVFEEYTLTENGKKYYTEYASRDGWYVKAGDMVGKFCYAEKKLDEIANWTEPADMMGFTISEVTYKYSFDNIADWAKTEIARDKLKTFSGYELSKQPLTAKIGLQLTNKGWD